MAKFKTRDQITAQLAREAAMRISTLCRVIQRENEPALRSTVPLIYASTTSPLVEVYEARDRQSVVYRQYGRITSRDEIRKRPFFVGYLRDYWYAQLGVERIHNGKAL